MFISDHPALPELHPDHALIDPPVTVTFGTGRSQSSWTDRQTMPFSALAEKLSSAKVGAKDGPCFTPATFTGTSRVQHEAAAIGVAVLDSDIGYTMAEIVHAVEAQGWRALIHSTHSHLSTATEISAANYDKWIAANPGETVAGYMQAKKGYLARVVRDAEFADPEPITAKDGSRAYRVLHAPCPKFRVVLPLATPWRAADYASQDAAIDAWKASYAALMAAFRLKADGSCTDPNRLFFLPRKRDNGAEFLFRELAGDLVDLNGLPDAPAELIDVTGEPVVTPAERDGAAPEPIDLGDGEAFDWKSWAAEFAPRFEIETALKARKPGVFGSRHPGTRAHLLCPSAEDHVTGPMDKGGTFVVNASNIEGARMRKRTTGFIIHCSHNGCQGHDRLHHLANMVAQGWLSVADLTDPAFLVPQPEVDIDPLLAKVTAKANAAMQEKAEQDAAAKRAARDEANWPDPIDFIAESELTGVTELRPEHLPDAVWPFVKDNAERLGVDPIAPALAALCSLASAVSSDWTVQPKEHDDGWKLPLILWVTILGSPGAKKSPIIRTCTAPLDELEKDARVRHAKAMREHMVEHHRWKTDKSEDKQNPAKEPKAPLVDRYIVEGTTVEALSEVLRTDHRQTQRAPLKKVLLRQDELSEWAASFDAYKHTGGAADRGAYLRLKDGSSASNDRVGRGTVFCEHWAAGLIGGIQPEPIRRIAQKSDDDGLLARMLYAVLGDATRGADRKACKTARQRYFALFRALITMQPASDILTGPHTATLHPEAHKHRLRIDDMLEAMSAMPDTSVRLKGMFAKWGATWAQIAFLYHLIDCADPDRQGDPLDAMVVSEDAARRAALYMEQILLPHTLKADVQMFQTEGANHARWIALHILAQNKEEITRREVLAGYQAMRNPETKNALNDIMTSLTHMGWLKEEGDSRSMKPVTTWSVNPKVLRLFAERGAVERARRKADVEAITAKIRASRSKAG